MKMTARTVVLCALLAPSAEALLLRRGAWCSGKARAGSARCELAAERDVWERKFLQRMEAAEDETSLKNTFKKLAANAHPDNGGSADKFQTLMSAYNKRLAECESAREREMMEAVWLCVFGAGVVTMAENPQAALVLAAGLVLAQTAGAIRLPGASDRGLLARAFVFTKDSARGLAPSPPSRSGARCRRTRSSADIPPTPTALRAASPDRGRAAALAVTLSSRLVHRSLGHPGLDSPLHAFLRVT